MIITMNLWLENPIALYPPVLVSDDKQKIV